MDPYEHIDDEGYIKLKHVAGRWGCSIADTIDILKHRCEISALVFDVEVVHERRHYEKEGDAHVAKDVELLDGAVKVSEAYIPLPASYLFAFSEGETKTVPTIDVPDLVDSLEKGTKDFYVYKPQSKSGPFSLSQGCLHVKKNDVEKIETVTKGKTGTDSGKPFGGSKSQPGDNFLTQRALLKMLGALIITEFKAEKYRKSRGINALSVAEELKNRLSEMGYSDVGIGVRTLTNIIPKAYEAIEENKEKAVEDSKK